jgi:hypothetical protein
MKTLKKLWLIYLTGRYALIQIQRQAEALNPSSRWQPLNDEDAFARIKTFALANANRNGLNMSPELPDFNFGKVEKINKF